MYEVLKEFIKPELLCLVPVLYLVGAGLKRSKVADRHIPWILGSCGVVLSLIFIIATSSITGVRTAFAAAFSGITQGILAAGASVYVNQMLKQRKKEDQ